MMRKEMEDIKNVVRVVQADLGEHGEPSRRIYLACLTSQGSLVVCLTLTRRYGGLS
jgi:hypothetical protein